MTAGKFRSAFVAADHAGVALKSVVVDWLSSGKTVEVDSVIDLGTFDFHRVDYPDYARYVCNCISDEDDFGILICASGIGMSMAANRYRHIRAALVFDKKSAELSRSHNDANVLVLASESINSSSVEDILNSFLTTEFLGGVYADRLKMI